MNNFYVYIYLDGTKPGNYDYNGCKLPFEPFYVGKGSKNRHLVSSHQAGGAGAFLINKIEKLGKDNVLIEFLLRGVSEDCAFAYEGDIVEIIGKRITNKGPLVNLADGGKGGQSGVPQPRGKDHWMYGKRHSEETKRKRSKSRMGHIVSEETRQKISKANKGRKLSKEQIRKMSESLKGRTAWNKGKKCPQCGRKGYNHSEESKQKMQQSSYWKGKHLPEETKQKMSISAIKSWESRDKEKMAEITRKRFSGEKSSTAKISNEQARQIREIYATQKISMIKLGEQFSVTRGSIFNIIHKKTFKAI